MLDVMDEIHAQVAEKETFAAAQASVMGESEGIEMQNVDIVTPNGLNLAEGVSVSVKPGKGLLVTGPNGFGKTSFFRVMAGLWPLRNPDARIVRPAPEDLVLVPQRVYSVTGSLADQVTYPHRLAERTPEDEAKMMACLEQVGISFLVGREKGGWDAVKPWEDTLSLGEQQRMGLARLLYSRPKFGVLDECTDAVSADVETQLYEALHGAGISCITISKRLALTEFHSEELRLGAPDARGWELALLSSS
jgi:ABC-type uncharacterized transport system fused permease/ATPase subunit